MHISVTLKSTCGSFLSEDFQAVLDERAKLRSSRLHKVRNRLHFISLVYKSYISNRSLAREIRQIYSSSSEKR